MTASADNRRIRFRDETYALRGRLPRVGETAPDFRLVYSDMRDVTLARFDKRRKVLNIFPSVDTPTCAESIRQFDAHAARYPADAMLMISADLPFAMTRFCGGEGLRNVFTLSCFRSPEFASDYGVELADGAWRGLCARACIVLDVGNTVLHAELVDDLIDEPDYRAALAALDNH